MLLACRFQLLPMAPAGTACHKSQTAVKILLSPLLRRLAVQGAVLVRCCYDQRLISLPEHLSSVTAPCDVAVVVAIQSLKAEG